MLTPQQMKFAQSYINKRDVKEAALAAGIDKKFASKIGEDWIKLPEVIEYCNQEIDKSIEKVKITREWVMQEAKKVYLMSPKDTDKLSALSLIDKLITKVDDEGDISSNPKVVIVSNDDLKIL